MLDRFYAITSTALKINAPNARALVFESKNEVNDCKLYIHKEKSEQVYGFMS